MYVNPSDIRVLENEKAAFKIKNILKSRTGKDYPINVMLYNNNKLVRNRKIILDKPVIGIVIKVNNYDIKTDAHALAAVIQNGNLYCFNPWGGDSLSDDLNIFTSIFDLYKCTNIDIYYGKNLQKQNTRGACVGYVSNFITEMITRINNKTLPEFISLSDYDEFVEKISNPNRNSLYGHTPLNSVNRSVQVYNNMFSPKRTVANLKQTARDRGLKGYSKLKKANLERLVNTKNTTTKRTVANLKQTARNRGLKGYSKLKKANLERLINTNKINI